MLRLPADQGPGQQQLHRGVQREINSTCSTLLQETQTKPEGQIHFFPIIFDGKQLYDVMVERCGPSMTSGPKK